MGKFIDLVGRRFGRLVVLKRSVNCGARTVWECKCDCGNICNVKSYCLRDGTTRSCGCLQREWAAEQGKNNATHNSCHTKLYIVWKSMKQRCYYTGNRSYKHYGGRGISICDEWLNDFNNFKIWAYNNGYSEDLTIERKNVNGNYCPENCTWVPIEDQARNKRGQLKYMGKTLSQWAHELGLNRQTVYARYHRYKWSIEEALGLKPHNIQH